jgi:hypothetical protein
MSNFDQYAKPSKQKLKYRTVRKKPVQFSYYNNILGYSLAINIAHPSIFHRACITESRKIKQYKSNDYRQWNDLHIQFHEQKLCYKS